MLIHRQRRDSRNSQSVSQARKTEIPPPSSSVELARHASLPRRPCNDVYFFFSGGKRKSTSFLHCNLFTKKCAAPNLLKKILKKNLFSFPFMTGSPTSPPPLPGKNHSLINIVERETRSNFCIIVMQASRTRVPVARSLSPSPRLLIFNFPACPFVMDTFAKLLSPPFLSPGGGGLGRLKVQVRRKTNVFIAGLFSFPKSGKTGPFHHWPFIKLLPKSSSRSFALQPTRDNSSLFSSAWM